MSKVTGATVLEGKYVNVRGLQGRYVSVQLNGTQLPSADPDGNSISLDIFPSDLLQNITTIKTFTPDQPGNFTGGSVDIRTKSFPDDLSVSFSASTSVNANIGLNGSLLNVEGGLDEIPDIVSEPFSLPSEVEISQNEEAANTMDAAARAFRQPAAPTTETVLANQSYDLSFGNQYEVGGMPLGVLASGTFSRGNSGYDSGLVARFQQTGAESDELRSTARYTSVRGESKTQYSGLLNVSLRPHPNHEVGVNTVYTRQNTDEARFQSGRLPRDLTGDQIFQTRTLRTVKRDVRSGQLRGEHLFKGLRGTRLEWNAALSRSTQDEPDYRFFSNHFRIGEADGDTTYTIAPSIYPVPARYFRDLQETNQSGDVSISIPVLDGNVKVGGSFLNKSREYRERRFDHRSGQISFSGDPNAYINEDAGLIGQSGGLFRFGTFLDDATQIQANYDGEQTVAAGFGMIDTAIPGLEAIRVIAGARVEHTDMTTENVDPATGSTAENGLSGSFTTTRHPSLHKRGRRAGREPEPACCPLLDDRAPVLSRVFAGSDL